MKLTPYIQYGLSLGASEIELFYSSRKETSVAVRKGEVERVESALDQGLSVRIVAKGRFGFSYTTSLTPADIQYTIDTAMANAHYTEKDTWLQLPKAKIQKNKIALKNYDKKIESLLPQTMLTYALAAEKAAYDHDARVTKTESSTFFATVATSILENSKGVNVKSKETSCGISLEVIAEQDSQMEAAYDYQYATHLKDIDPVQVGKNAAVRATRMLGAGMAKTGVYTLVLPPKTAVSFISVLLSSFTADAVQKKKSFLRGKKNKKVAASIVSLVDDPFLVGALGSALYDGEGVPTTKKMLIKKGILNSYLYDTYTAAKEGIVSTGNASRGSIKAEPSIGPTNLYVMPGKESPAKLIAHIKQGIIIHSVMGLHTADPISGEFSLGATGVLIENGKETSAVKEIAIAGNLQQFMKSISAIGNDLEFSASLGSPTLVVDTISVAGK